MQAVKGFGGIYIWQNLLNGKRYVGSSINLRKRLSNYYEAKDKSTRGQSIIFNALAKYSHSNFSLTVILIAPKEAILALEQFAIDSYQFHYMKRPEYNILKLAGFAAGYTHTEVAKAKISDIVRARGLKGNTHPSWNKGKAVFLYSVVINEGDFTEN
jgi:group I intron endonuclease